MTCIITPPVAIPTVEEHWTLSADLEEVAPAWSAAAPAANVFLQLPYLRALAAAPPEGMALRYAVYSQAGRPIGVVLLQLATFWAAKNIRTDAGSHGFRQRMYAGMRRAVSQRAAFRTLTCGNFLLSGQHGFYFDPDAVKLPRQLILVEQALELAKAQFAEQRLAIDGFFVKDINAASAPTARRYFTKRQFHEVGFQPNMVLRLRPDWREMPDYLAAMTSKYRVRARKVLKLAQPIGRQRWTTATIVARRHELFALYRQVAQQAAFNLLYLTPDYLPALADRLGDDFRLTVYTLAGRLVGFRTTIANGDTLEAHFLGYDVRLRRTHRLYQAMLYDLVAEALAGGYRGLVFARTALEMKSTVGATPESLVSFLRHDKSWANRLLPRVFNYLAPKVEWTQRRPFKSGELL